MIEQIIRKLLLEQSNLQPTAAVPKTSTQVITVIIKTGLRSADIAEAQDAGAVAGFQLKAIAKRRNGELASKQSVEKAIAQRINQNQTLQRFLNGNYLFIRSADQRDSKKNYLYNYWILPKNYIEELMWIYKSSVTKSKSGQYNVALGLPSGGIQSIYPEVTVSSGALPLANNTPHLSANRIIDLINLKPVTSIIDKTFIDATRYKKAYEWLVQLKTINKKISTADLQTPEELLKIPDTILVSESDPLTVQLSKNIWSRTISKIQFYGNFDTKNNIPLDGKLILTDPTTIIIYDGSFKSTNERSKFKYGSDQIGYYAINIIDLNNGNANNLPLQLDIKTGNRQETPDGLPTHQFTGIIRNGQLSQGKLNRVLADEYFEGYFKNNKPFNGILWDENNKPKNKYVNGIQVDYKSYDGPVYEDSDTNVIRSLQVDMIEMFTTNLEFFESRKQDYPIDKFINQTPSGKWDNDMQELIELINVIVAYKSGNRDIDINKVDRDQITQDTHQWIIKHKNQKIQ